MPNIELRLEAIRACMRSKQIDAWIITGTDPHVSEYVAPRWRTREWISGFTGSAGTVVVTLDKALLWVDSRYFIQGAQQIEGTSFELQKLETPGVLNHVQWLSKHLSSGAKVGVEGQSLTISSNRVLLAAFAQKNISLVYTADWFEDVWTDRPPIPAGEVTSLTIEVAGTSAAHKIEKIQNICASYGCSHTFISSLDDIAWILNLRGSDIAFNPVFLSYLLIGKQQVVLFTDSRRFTNEQMKELSQMLEIRGYEEVFSYLEEAFEESSVLYLSNDKTNVRIQESIPSTVRIIDGRDISTDLKACKSPIEIEGMRRAHLLDGIAMVKFLAAVSRQKSVYTELTLAEELVRCRKEHKEYLGPSFSPIAGFGPHGALAHYSANESSSVELIGNGLLVLDSGGQYVTGTTDITRTLLFGEASTQMKQDYTLVLKGNLALAAQRFPTGTCGYQLDVLARQFLWQAGCSYGHGTGHGVGFRLNVHEGPQNVSPKPLPVALEEGMVISDEPGIYREGVHGVRIENLLVVQPFIKTEFGEFLAFDVLTLCPFERKLIDVALLTEKERKMVDAYHGWVYAELHDALSEEDAAWLREVTLPL
jgi:Xaa-Pro aminopeptidase